MRNVPNNIWMVVAYIKHITPPPPPPNEPSSHKRLCPKKDLHRNEAQKRHLRMLSKSHLRLLSVSTNSHVKKIG
jgi:hypothetical protein